MGWLSWPNVGAYYHTQSSSQTPVDGKDIPWYIRCPYSKRDLG